MSQYGVRGALRRRSSWNSWCLGGGSSLLTQGCEIFLTVCGGHQKLCAAVAKMVEVLSAPTHDSFQPIKVMTPVLRRILPVFESAGIHAETDGSNAQSRLQRALSRGAVGRHLRKTG